MGCSFRARRIISCGKALKTFSHMFSSFSLIKDTMSTQLWCVRDVELSASTKFLNRAV
jgi:hypothetical protein